MKRSKRSFLVKTALLLMVAVGLSSCRHADVHDALLRAEALMESDPHAARAVLDSLSDHCSLITDHFSQRDAALYALLKTQADYKCRARLTSDSLPLIAANYYGNKRKSQYAALAQYYLGCTYKDMRRDLDAIDALLRATTLFSDTTNKYFANSLFELGLLYRQQNMFDSAFVAFRHYRQTNVCHSDSVNISFADYNMGLTALYKGEDSLADSLFLCVKQNTKGSAHMRNDINYQLAKQYLYRKHDAERASEYLEKYMSYAGENSSALLLCAEIQAERHEPKQAYTNYRKCLKNSNDLYLCCTAYKGLSYIAPLLDKTDSARYFMNRYEALLDSIYAQNQHIEIDAIKNNHVIEIHDQQMRTRQARLFFWVSIFVVALLAAVAILFLLIDRRRKVEKLKYEESLNSLRQQQVEQLAQVEKVTPEAEGYVEEPDAILDVSSDAEAPLEASPFTALQEERIKLYRQQYAASVWPSFFQARKAEIKLEKKLDAAHSEEFMNYLDGLFADTFVSMLDANHKLTKYDLQYCAMVMLELTTAQMAYCTQATIHSYHCRHGKMKALLSDDWYRIVYGRKKI